MCRESECPCEVNVICGTPLRAMLKENGGSDIFDPNAAQTVVINTIADRVTLSPVDSKALQIISEGRFPRSFSEVRQGILDRELSRDDVVREWEFDGH